MTALVGKAAEYFPYPSVRPFQDILANTIYEAVEKGSHVLLEGSNGLGKTVAALSACLPVAKERGLKILYTAKTHRQHDRVIEELRVISKRQTVSGLSIRGRCEMCLHPLIARHAPDARSAMEICELLKARGECPYHGSIGEKFDRFSELLSHVSSTACSATEIQEACRAEGFCPYELVKTALGEADIIALSYLYVFDPPIRSALLKHLERPLNQVLLIVDEAHNLPETAIEIASDTLTLFTIRQAEREAKQFDYKDIAVFCREFMRIIERMVVQVEGEKHLPPGLLLEKIRVRMGLDEPLTFFEHLHTTGNLIKRALLAEGRYPRSHIHKLGEFLVKWLETSSDASFTHILSRYVTKTGSSSARLEIVALDPSRITAPVLSSVYCSVGISGTLEPLESYMKITRMPETTVRKAVPSPFPEEHILSLVCRGVTTAMKQRTKSMYKKLVKRIAEAVRYSPDANVGVFTASYEVSQGLLGAELEGVMDRKLFVEHQGMSSRENDSLIERFKSYAGRGGAVLLGVEGGRASEGADYPRKQMETVIIVGVPYAQPSTRVDAQIRYYEAQFPGHGREYGYVWPALRRASQAAGRPIRGLDDRGAIVFLDYRFSTRYCQRFLPLWIRRNIKTLPDGDGDIARELILFYGFPEGWVSRKKT